MDSNIQKIHKNNSDLIEPIMLVIFFFRSQNFDSGLRLSNAILGKVEDSIKLIFEETQYFNRVYQDVDFNEITMMFRDLIEAQQNKDYVLLADIYEASIYPFICVIQQVIYMNEGLFFDEAEYKENIEAIKYRDIQLRESIKALPDPRKLLEQNYIIELTSCGLYTLALNENGKKYYFHSNNNVFQDAFTLANFWYTNKKSTKYIVYGLGLGYHVMELGILNVNIEIEVYESDLNIIQLACAYSPLKKILSKPNITIIYDPDFSRLVHRLADNNNAEFVIHNPSIRNIKSETYKEKLENYFIQYSSARNQWAQLIYNFNKNVINCDSEIDILKDQFKGKTLYIVAAGPSLDKNFMLLNEVEKDDIILATGTVFKKLINSGITPNYVLVTDANERVYKQIENYEDYQIPMLVLSTAYCGFANNYKGKKYIIYQKDFTKAEEAAKAKGSLLFNTGGSVSTLALDIGINFGCKRIVCIGLDLAYTDNYLHAADTSYRELKNVDGLKEIEDINGNMIYTSKSLEIYRQWIENRINETEGIEFIDATEGGAKIRNMKIMKLKECFKASSN